MAQWRGLATILITSQAIEQVLGALGNGARAKTEHVKLQRTRPDELLGVFRTAKSGKSTRLNTNGLHAAVDRNTLAREPFDCNSAFFAVAQLHTKEISNALIGGRLAHVFTHVGRVRGTAICSFDKIVPALSCLRRGQHMGKLVISSGGANVDAGWPVCLTVLRLQLDLTAVYLVVGRLQALCGRLAVHLAGHSARRVVVVNRSGTGDGVSARVIKNCATWNCA